MGQVVEPGPWCRRVCTTSHLQGDKYVAAIADLTPIRDGIGPRNYVPPYSACVALHTGAALPTDMQRDRIEVLFADADQVGLELTWSASTSAPSPPTEKKTGIVVEK